MYSLWLSVRRKNKSSSTYVILPKLSGKKRRKKINIYNKKVVYIFHVDVISISQCLRENYKSKSEIIQSKKKEWSQFYPLRLLICIFSLLFCILTVLNALLHFSCCPAFFTSFVYSFTQTPVYFHLMFVWFFRAS